MPRTHAALIVDSDPKGLESLVYGFQGGGWRSTACPAPETASLLVKASGAEIVVIASRGDHEKTHALLRQLRGRDLSRSLPILLLAPEEMRVPAKQYEDVDLLPLPAFVRDVLSASQLLVGNASATGKKARDERCFEDVTSSQGSLSLVRTMNGIRRSGSLHLGRKGRHGEMLFSDGELTAAQVGQLQGLAAVQHLLVWNDGNLELRLRPVVRRGQLHQGAQEFLEELERFQRDYSHAMKDVGPPDTVYVVNQDRLRSSAGVFPAEVTPVVRLCDGERSLCDVIDESPFRVLDTVRIVSRLVELAIVSRREPKSAESSEQPRPLDAFWATARITMTGEDRISTRPSRSTPVPAPPATAEMASINEDAAMKSKHRRPTRQTQEIGKPSTLTSSSSGALPAATSKEAGSAANLRPDATTKRVDTAKRLTPSMGTSLSTSGDGVATVSAPASAQTSGAFELRKSGRSAQQSTRTPDRRRSVVIDTALVSVVDAGHSHRPPQAESITAPADATNASVATPPSVAASVAPSAAGAAPEPQATSAPVVATAAAAAAAQPAAEENAVPPGTAAGIASSPVVIVVPPTASPATDLRSVAAVPMAETKKAPSEARVTGEMQVVPSGRSSRVPARVGAASSFHIDPSLTAEVPAKPARPNDNARASQPAHPPQGHHRPSGSFSAVESDFFEREADLYKVDKAESFADLDENKGAQDGKGKLAVGPGKRK